VADKIIGRSRILIQILFVRWPSTGNVRGQFSLPGIGAQGHLLAGQSPMTRGNGFELV
jgi:hypothetical protein